MTQIIDRPTSRRELAQLHPDEVDFFKREDVLDLLLSTTQPDFSLQQALPTFSESALRQTLKIWIRKARNIGLHL